jgi:hypothetical protein
MFVGMESARSDAVPAISTSDRLSALKTVKQPGWDATTLARAAREAS